MTAFYGINRYLGIVYRLYRIVPYGTIHPFDMSVCTCIKMFSNINLPQFILNCIFINSQYRIANMRTIRGQIKKRKIDRVCDRILRIALDPRNISVTLAAIRDVNASFQGKIHYKYIKNKF